MSATENEKREFKFCLGQDVSLILSSEEGRVIGRAEYTNSRNSYLIRYKAADGRQVESWWPEDAIKGVI